MGGSTMISGHVKKLNIRVEIKMLQTWVLLTSLLREQCILQIDSVFKKPASLVKPLCPLQVKTF